MSDKFLVDDLDGDDRILIAELVKRVYNKYPEIVYHYTSLDSAIKIIDSKVIHFRDSRLLADNTEQRNVFNILNEMISMDEYSDDFKRYAYQICQDEYLDQYISSDLQNNRFSDISRFFVFSCSFDEHSEYLISTYAKRNNPIGCRITINAKDLGEQFYPQYLEIVPIIYNEQDKRALVKLIVDHAYLKFKRAMSDEDKKNSNWINGFISHVFRDISEK